VDQSAAEVRVITSNTKACEINLELTAAEDTMAGGLFLSEKTARRAPRPYKNVKE
jgi:hypothetical protein